MKKTTLVLSLLLLSVCYTYTQHQVIYQPPANRSILAITSFRNNQNSGLSFYLSLSGHSVNAQPPFWIRYYRNSNSWDNSPHNSFLGGTTCFNGTGGFAWSRTAEIRRSQVDTNLILTRFDWMACNVPEAGYRNKVTYNSGVAGADMPDVGMYDIEIDKVNDSLIYGVGAVYLGPTKFWYSSNKGASWSSFTIPGSAISPHKLKINPLKRNEVYFSSSQQFFRTTNAGANFTLVNTFATNVSQIEIDPVDSTIFILTSDRNLYRSTNGGLNFPLVAGVSLNQIYFTPENHLRLYGAVQNGLYISTNGGVNWQLYFDNFSGSSIVNGIVKYPNDGDTVYASSSSGLYKIWASVIGTNQISTEVPSHFSLSQNYPNPFNPETKISFNIPLLRGVYAEGGRGVSVRLSVYDMLGREVAILVNQNLQPGTYEVNWNAADFPSGIYFYRLEAVDPSTSLRVTETRKMVLIK